MNCKIYHIGGADSTVATIGLADESRVIAHVPYETPDDRANAEFIVRAVNSHDALLAACRAFFALWPVLPGRGEPKATPDVLAAWRQARAAIAQATGNELARPEVSENLNQPL